MYQIGGEVKERIEKTPGCPGGGGSPAVQPGHAPCLIGVRSAGYRCMMPRKGRACINKFTCDVSSCGECLRGDHITCSQGEVQPHLYEYKKFIAR